MKRRMERLESAIEAYVLSKAVQKSFIFRTVLLSDSSTMEDPFSEDVTQHLSSLPSASVTQCFFGQFGLPRAVDDIFLVSLSCVLLPN